MNAKPLPESRGKYILVAFFLGYAIILLLLPHIPLPGRREQHMFGGNFVGTNPHMAPNGRQIVYASPRTGGGDIYVVGTNGSGPKRLTSSPEYEGEPSYSPDGSKIVYLRE